MSHFGEKNVLNHFRSLHTFRLSSVAYVGRILVSDAMVFYAVFQPLRNFVSEIKAFSEEMKTK